MLLTLYSEVNVLCILILLLIYYKIKSGPYNQSEQQALKWVLLSNCLLFATDIAWIFIDSKDLSVGYAANWFINILYYIVGGLVSFFWFLYSERIQEAKTVQGKRNIFLCLLPVILITLLSLISIKTGWLFYIDEFNSYHRGSLYPLQLISSYGYIICTAVKALILSGKTASYAQKTKYLTLAIFVVPSLVAGFLQVLMPGISLLCVGTTFGILYIYMTMQEQLISVDGLTGLNNHIRMMRQLFDRMAHHDPNKALFLVMMDLDYFKQINDHYGHVEGDNALRKTADALKSCGKNSHCFIARYGGDEFAMICELNQNESIETICSGIREAIAKVNNDCPYNLSLSIGYARYDPSVKTDKDFIKLADAELYKVKLARAPVER